MQAVNKVIKALVSFDPDFLKMADDNWKKNKFKNRSEYIMYLIRNDLKKVQ